MGEMDGNEDEDSGFAAISHFEWKGGVGNVFGHSRTWIWNGAKAEGQWTMAARQSRNSVNVRGLKSKEEQGWNQSKAGTAGNVCRV